VKKSGAWYTYEGEQLGQGRENAKAFLTEHPEVMVEIQDRVLRAVGIGQGESEESESTDLSDDVVDPDDLPITLD